jgi:hypothetical protein
MAYAFRIVVIACVTLSLAGCMSRAESLRRDEDKCRSEGFKPNTQAFAECMRRLNPPFVSISRSNNDCISGISMSVSVTIEGETFRFNPSCGFSFNDSFTTKRKHKCKIDAGMCSGFSPANAIEVHCDDGARASTDVACPKK